MAQFPSGDVLALPATLNQINWVVISADYDYFLLEASLSPQGNAAGNVSAVVGKLTGTSEIPGNPTVDPQFPTAFTSTNNTFPSRFVDVYIGNRKNANSLITLGAVYNQEYKNLVGAIPILFPPIIRKGEVIVVGAKNLSSAAQNVAWNLNAIRVSRHAAILLAEDTMSGTPAP